MRDQIDQLKAENARLFRRLSDQERFNIKSRQSLCEQSDGYKDRMNAAEGRLEKLGWTRTGLEWTHG